MSKATEEELSRLHGAFAKTLGKQLNAPLYHEGAAVENTEGLGCSAATLSVIATFLKNNNIQADPTKDDSLQDLAAQLAKRREDAKRSLRRTDLDAAAAAFERSLGGFGSIQ